MLFDDTMRDILAKAKTIAIIGAKDKPGQAVDTVGRYMIKAGYTVIPVHPVRQNVWGLTTYASITDIPVAVDIVNLFRASQYCPEHAREVLAMAHRPAAFWMQLGISSPEAGALMAQNNIAVIEDKCIMVEHQRVMR
ncbi:CoA-binding protein [Oleidesulfovibrio sp.]|uniref:CoA-binding protein n=1 Tax=Oleidesulfovibrio sp. TaxID=2909707 RepID=UPI003A8B757D